MAPRGMRNTAADPTRRTIGAREMAQRMPYDLSTRPVVTRWKTVETTRMTRKKTAMDDVLAWCIREDEVDDRLELIVDERAGDHGRGQHRGQQEKIAVPPDGPEALQVADLRGRGDAIVPGGRVDLALPGVDDVDRHQGQDEQDGTDEEQVLGLDDPGEGDQRGGARAGDAAEEASR